MGTVKDMGARVRAAREAAGLSQQQLSELVGVSRPGVSKIESGQRDVSAAELAVIATVVGLTVDDLLGRKLPGPLDRVDIRGSLSPSGASAVEAAIGAGRALARALGALHELLDVPSPPRVRSDARLPDLPVLAVLQGHHAGTSERQRLGLGSAGQVPLGAALDRDGVVVLQWDLPPEVSGFAVRDVDPAGLIVLRSADGSARKRYTLARELGYLYFLDAAPYATAGKTGVLAQMRADAFAGALLLPSAQLQASWAEVSGGRAGSAPVVAARVITVARWHGVSATAVVRRLCQSGLLPGHKGEAVVAELRARGRDLSEVLGFGPQDVFDELDASLARMKRLVLEVQDDGRTLPPECVVAMREVAAAVGQRVAAGDEVGRGEP